MGCCFTNSEPQLQLAASIAYDNQESSDNIMNWSRDEVQNWLQYNKDLKSLQKPFHQHQISGLTLATITKDELINELNIKEDILCDIFIKTRDKFVKQSGEDNIMHINKQIDNSSTGTIENTIEKKRDSVIDIEIKYISNSVPRANTFTESKINIIYLYNLLQQFNMEFIRTKIIDLRDSSLFIKSHILTSVNINIDSSASASASASDNDNDNLHIIDSHNKVSFEKHLQSFKLQTKLIIIYNKNNKNILKKFENYVFDIYKLNKFVLLDASFNDFYAKYSFLCSSLQDKYEEITVKYPTEIIENKLYIGDFKQSENFKILNDLKINYILNMNNKKHNKLNMQIKCNYKHIPLIDDVKQNIELDDSIKWIDSCLNGDNDDNDNRILVHCMEGISRSATIIIGYLMYSNKWDYESSFEYLKNIRPSISPNAGFVQQLKEYQIKLNIQ